MKSIYSAEDISGFQEKRADTEKAGLQHILGKYLNMENLILITGNDSLAIKNKAESLINMMKKNADDEYSFEIISGDTEDCSPMKILEELSIAVNTPSFFGSTKTIWIKHFSGFELAVGKEKKCKQFQETFKEILERISW